MSRVSLRGVFVAGTALFSLWFVGLTIDTLGRMPILTNEWAMTSKVVEGKMAWQRHDCIGCHTILGNGSYYAPDLTKVAVTRGSAFVAAWLAAPAGQMPAQRLTTQEVDSLTAFLVWVAQVDTNGWPPAPITGGAAGQTGATLFQSKGCAACHGSQGEGTAAAPTLKGVTARLDNAYLTGWLRDPKALKPAALMPKPNLNDSDITTLIAHLRTLN